MPTFHKFMYCDHSRPNGLGSQVMRMTRIEHPDKWSVGLLALMEKTKASKMAVPTYYCEDCDAEFSADDECCCPDATFKH